ncbi:MAG TPA: globin [Acidimicrobiaceae bacterium]|nr:globin [Acidimicrobiaceae bacterium]HCV34597.1 globin [Acidimicrobiaceae bacterium]|tara:strand:+ start:1424 stop:1846 length:423 start_codon:yes stop_codon:yes gene_type:complete
MNLPLGRDRIWTTREGKAHDTLYEMVGSAWFDELAARFYKGVASDPVLRSLYPDDLQLPTDRLAGFLRQYWGGPPEYSKERGHPRLRMRHAPFVISFVERDSWLRCMADALVDSGLPPAAESAVMEYFQNAAQHLVNASE